MQLNLQSRGYIVHIMETKTNVMRILDAHHVPYKSYTYDVASAPSGDAVAAALHQNPAQVFKTLVTVARSGNHYVFMIPVCSELDLKRAATAVHEKSIDMLKQRDLLGLTGYIHGGCSPIGMKKQFKTVADASANNFATIIFSAGRPGYQVEISPTDLSKLIPLSFSDVCISQN